jgi:hypothetical protein
VPRPTWGVYRALVKRPGGRTKAAATRATAWPPTGPRRGSRCPRGRTGSHAGARGTGGPPWPSARLGRPVRVHRLIGVPDRHELARVRPRQNGVLLRNPPTHQADAMRTTAHFVVSHSALAGADLPGLGTPSPRNVRSAPRRLGAASPMHIRALWRASRYPRDPPASPPRHPCGTDSAGR